MVAAWSCEDVVGNIRGSLVANRKGGQLAAFFTYKLNLYRIYYGFLHLSGLPTVVFLTRST